MVATAGNDIIDVLWHSDNTVMGLIRADDGRS